MKRTFSKLLTIACALSFASIAVADESSQAKSGSEGRVESKASRSTAGNEAKSKNAKGSGDAKQVEMFDAMDRGILQVKYVGKDATQANIIFENKTGDTLDVVLPETFGAIHINPQFGMGGMGGMGGGMGMGGMGGGMGGMGMGGMGGMGGQSMGGGMGGMGGMGMGGMGGGMGGMGMGGMGGMMRVEPDKIRKITVPTLCLEHGKKDPNPRMKYKIVRLEEVNDSPVVAQLCKAVANGKVTQNVGQAAAWHVANGLSWQELLAKPRSFNSFGVESMYFSRRDLDNALLLVSTAASEADMLEDATHAEEPAGSHSEESVGEILSREAAK